MDLKRKHVEEISLTPCKKHKPERKDFVFHHFYVDVTDKREKYSRSTTKKFDPGCGGSNVLLQIFGRTKDGKSVMCNVSGFYPHFFILVPREMSEKELSDFMRRANSICIKDRYGKTFSRPMVAHVENFRAKKLYFFNNMTESNFIRVIVNDLSSLNEVKRALKNGMLLNEADWGDCEIYEGSINPELQFMVDQNFSGFTWLSVPFGKFETVSGYEKQSYCDIEIRCKLKDLTQLSLEEAEGNAIASFKILSFDIECLGKLDSFPTPENDPVILIGAVISDCVTFEVKKKVAFVLNDSAPVEGVEIRSFKGNDAERRMLRAFQEFIILEDFDILLGYNSTTFDVPYLIARAAALGLSIFPYLGRIKNKMSVVTTNFFHSTNKGRHERKQTPVLGRIHFDVYMSIRMSMKARSYKLNDIAYTYLKETKEDVHYTEIAKLYGGSSKDRAKLVRYCITDCLLPLKLTQKLSLLFGTFELSRVCGISVSELVVRGEQIKCFSLILREAKARGFCVPSSPPMNNESYIGATVLEPISGYYDCPVLTLDFASLYPSIIMAHNLCYTTFLLPGRATQLGLVEDVDYATCPNGAASDSFVKSEKYRGILPSIVEKLVKRRKKTKALMAAEKDEFKKMVLDIRQLVLKLIANSVYGFTGAHLLQLKQISRTVTGYGRNMIEKTKKMMEEFHPGSKVIYGDTDSVMAKIEGVSLEEAFQIGKNAAAFITQHFRKPIELEFENVYWKYLLLKKKMYAGLSYTSLNAMPKLTTKGIKVRRRDNPEFMGNLLKSILNAVFVDGNFERALELVKDVVRRIKMQQMDYDDLVISKELKNYPQDCKNPQAQTFVWKKIYDRDPGAAPKVGSRLLFVFIKDGNKKLSERAEDSNYAKENLLPLDWDYYLECVSKSVISLLEYVAKSIKGWDRKRLKRELFEGDHTRKIVKKHKPIGLLKFENVFG